MKPSGISLGGYRPGANGRVTELHGRYYHRHWGFGLYFESKVAAGLAAFLDRFAASRDGFWVALLEDEIVGSVTIEGGDAESTGARLRWFILAEEARGRGAGHLLLGAAMDFCRGAGFGQVHLHTFAGLDAARHLYQKYGFTLTGEHEARQWGEPVLEQRFQWRP
ncbi:MAG: GNAT family N-acetyltransferase [SAR324 cluster bacterium]|nr:GNAT family N-acetyltransferase [SAR324 cluster bacterium]